MGTSPHQSGWVVSRGKKWYGYCRQTVLDAVTNEQKIKTITLILGLRSRMTKFEAREELQKEIAKRTGQNISGRVMKDGSVTFEWFVRNRYLPLREANWKPETARVKRIQIQRDLVEKFEDVPLEVFDKFTLQTHFNHLARFLSKDRVLQARSFLKSIFSEAVEQGFLLKDPSRKVTAPRNLRAKDKTMLTWDELGLVLANLSPKDLCMVTLDMTDALRPGELFALRWRSFDGSKLTITETSTRERYGRGARRQRAWAMFTFRKD
jgi:integrase